MHWKEEFISLARVSSSDFARYELIPALLKTTSRRSNSWTVLSTIALMSVSLPTSQTTAMAFGASWTISEIRDTVLSAAGPLMSAQTTWAPSLANRMQVSRPIPLENDPQLQPKKKGKSHVAGLPSAWTSAPLCPAAASRSSASHNCDTICEPSRHPCRLSCSNRMGARRRVRSEIRIGRHLTYY